MPKIEPISCEHYDALEVACMHHYDVTVHMKDGAAFSGRAANTRIGSDRIEYFVLDVEESQIEVPMHQMCRMHILTSSAAISDVYFTDETVKS